MFALVFFTVFQSADDVRARVDEKFHREVLGLAREMEKGGLPDEARFLAAFAGEKIAVTAPKSRPSPAVFVRIGKFGQSYAPTFRRVGDGAMADLLERLGDHVQAFRLLNDRRRGCGVNPVEYDVTLARGCQLHCNYLQFAPDDGHHEDPSKSGYTPEGAEAGKRSVLHFQPRLADALEDWLATLYHRIPLLHPNLARIGTGEAKHPNGGFLTALDVYGGLESSADLSKEHQEYPPANATEVRLGFPAGGESPNPLPSGQEGQAGIAVTVSLWKSGAQVTKVKAKLLEGGQREVECWISSPEKPARQDWAANSDSICLIPKRLLRPRTGYLAVVECEVDGQPFQKRWSFTTGTR